MARAVERVPRIAGRAEQRIAGHLLVRAGDRPGARNRLGVVDEGAALGACQVIPAVPLEKMRAFDLAERSPAEDARPRPDQLPRLDVVFLHHDAVELVLPGSVVPGHLDVPLPPGTGDVAVIVVEQRSVKTHAIQVDRLGPWAVDRRAGHQEVLNVLERARPAADVGVDQPEQAVGVGQAWRPDAAGTRIAAHVQLRRTGQGVTDLLPVDQVARMRQRHTREPFEGGVGDVVVVADAADRWVGIETAQDGILDGPRGGGCHRTTPCWPGS